MKKRLSIWMTVLFLSLLIGCGGGGEGGNDSHSGEPSPPTVLTAGYESTSNTTGVGHGNVTSDGGVPPVFERGICWGTIPDPSKENGTCIGTSAGTGPFSEVLTGVLNDGSLTNYMRAYAINAIGISWGYSKLITMKTH